jgi:hypothetical protein
VFGEVVGGDEAEHVSLEAFEVIVIGQDLVYLIWKGLNDVTEESGAFHFSGMLVEFDVGELRDTVDDRLQTLMRIRDHQLDTAQAAAGEGAEKLRLEDLRLGGADGHAEHLAAAVIVDADGDDHGDRDNAPGLADFA